MLQIGSENTKTNMHKHIHILEINTGYQKFDN